MFHTQRLKAVREDKYFLCERHFVFTGNGNIKLYVVTIKILYYRYFVLSIID